MNDLRPAATGDLAAVRAIARAAYAPYVPLIGLEPPPMVADFGAALAAGALWVATAGAAPIGYVHAYPSAESFFIENLAVAPAAQGQGIGRRLVAFAEAEALRRGFHAVTLYTNAHMAAPRALYPRLGYAETGRRTEHGLDRIYFAKALMPA